MFIRFHFQGIPDSQRDYVPGPCCANEASYRNPVKKYVLSSMQNGYGLCRKTSRCKLDKHPRTGMVAKLKTAGIKLGKMIIMIPMFTLLIMGGYSWLIGWNLLSALGAWFILVPLATMSLSNLLGLKRIWQSGISMLCFYAWMVFGIYDHYQSDLFVLMMLSLIYNAFIFVLVILSERDERKHRIHQKLTPK